MPTKRRSRDGSTKVQQLSVQIHLNGARQLNVRSQSGLNTVRQCHRVFVNYYSRSTLVSPEKKTDSGHPVIHEKVPHSSPPRQSHQQSHQDCSTVGLFSLADSSFTLVMCLSCMTCSSNRSMYDPDLKLRRRHSTASPSSFVGPSANCCPVGATRITQPLFFKDSRMISTSLADRLSCSFDGGLSYMTAGAPCRSNGP